jgi:hypothetical protein
VSDVVIPTADESDTRDFIKVHAIACKNGDWAHPITDNEALIYEQQNIHFKATGHTGYWHYTITRSQSRIVVPGKGIW